MGKDPKIYHCVVVMLTGEEVAVDVTRATYGAELMKSICEQQSIAEPDFFGLKFKSLKDKEFVWLDHSKKVLKQLRGQHLLLQFSVRFYPPTTANLQDEVTRYLFCLHVRGELLSGRLICATPIHALLASYLVQGEFGDHSNDLHAEDYLKGMEFMPQQSVDLTSKVEEFHKKHAGLSPADCDFQFLESARKIPLFGLEMYHVKDSDDVEISLGVSSFGVIVLQHGRQVSRFSWPSVQRIYYNRKKFLIKVRSVVEEEYEDVVVGFGCTDNTMARRLFKSAVEHHTFFCGKSFQRSHVTKTAFNVRSKVRKSQRKTFYEKEKEGQNTSTHKVTRLPSRTFSSYYKEAAKRLGKN